MVVKNIAFVVQFFVVHEEKKLQQDFWSGEGSIMCDWIAFFESIGPWPETFLKTTTHRCHKKLIQVVIQSAVEREKESSVQIL